MGHSHGQYAQKFDEIRSRGSRVIQMDRWTNRHTHHNTSHVFWGRGKDYVIQVIRGAVYIQLHEVAMLLMYLHIRPASFAFLGFS